MSTSICIYFPGNPGALFEFLDNALRSELRMQDAPLKDGIDLSKYHSIILDPSKIKNFEFLLWVDNDDHKVSKEFYNLRKYLRKGLNIQVFVNPAIGSSDLVFNDLASKATGDQVIQNNGYSTDLDAIVAGTAIFQEEHDVKHA